MYFQIIQLITEMPSTRVQIIKRKSAWRNTADDVWLDLLNRMPFNRITINACQQAVLLHWVC